MKKKKDELELALRGYINPHQRLMIKTILTHIDFLSDQIELLNLEVATRMVEQILAEVGTDVERLENLGYNVTISEPNAS